MVEPVNLLLGHGELFFKRVDDTSGKYVRVGNLKGPVTFNYEMETAEQQPGNRLTVARRDKISEKATLSGQLADFKVSQLIASLGLSISTTQLTLTSTFRAFQEIDFGSTTSTKSIANTAVSMTSVVITSGDNSKNYVSGTDYTMPNTDQIKPITTTFANQMNLVAYDSADTASKIVQVGDKTVLQVVALKFTHRLSDGKFITIEIPRATVMGGLEIPFGDQEHTMFGISFQALGDTTAAPGKSLFKIIREA